MADWFDSNQPQQADWFSQNQPAPTASEPKQDGGVLSGITAGVGRMLNPINVVKGLLDIGHKSDIANIWESGKTVAGVLGGESPDEAIKKNMPELAQERAAVFGDLGRKEQAAAITGIGLQAATVALPFLHAKLPSIAETFRGASKETVTPATDAAAQGEVIKNATQERQVQENIPAKREGTDARQLPAEAGIGNSLQPETQVNEEGTVTPSEKEGQTHGAGTQAGDTGVLAEEGGAEKPPVPPLPDPNASGNFKPSALIDKKLGDQLEKVAGSYEQGALKAELAERKVHQDLTPEQSKDVEKYLLSRRLGIEEGVMENHKNVLSPEEMQRIENDPVLKKAIDTYDKEVKPEIGEIHKGAGVSEGQAAAKEEGYYTLIPKGEEVAPGVENVSQFNKPSKTTKFAKTSSGGAPEYESNFKTVMESAYGEALKKKNVADFLKMVDETNLTDEQKLVLQNQLKQATERPIEPTTGAPAVGRKIQRALTGAQLTLNPFAFVNHLRRVLSIGATVPPEGVSRGRRLLENLIPYIGPRAGMAERAYNLDFTPESLDKLKARDQITNPHPLQVLMDLFDAGGGSTRGFRKYDVSKIPGVGEMQRWSHDQLFGIPEGKGVKGWDLRMRVAQEMQRRALELDRDPRRMREQANRLGEYGSNQSWYIRAFKALNPYAATSGPMRLTELKQLFGFSGLEGKTPTESLKLQGETLLRGIGGTILALSAANYLLSGKWPWENKRGHEFDLDTGKKNDQGDPVYLKFRMIAPELSRPVNTIGLPNLTKESTAKNPQYLGAFGTAVTNAGLSLVGGPAQDAALTALTGKAPYLTKQPGKAPELLDVAKTEKGGNRDLEQLKATLRQINPAFEFAFPEKPYTPKKKATGTVIQ